MESGIVYDIMHFSTRGSPGTRTTVFLKGCPLSCSWCHNPEFQSFTPQLIRHQKFCVVCGVCLENCPNGAVTSGVGTINTNSHTCVGCGICVELCTTGAREMVGLRMSSTEVIAEVCKDISVFEQYQGYITFSGGEPLAQPEFVLELLKISKESDIYTTLNTSGFSQWSYLRSTLSYTDLYLYDIKSLDDKIHQKYTQVSNRIILENLDNLIRAGAKVIIRIPVIPGINDRPKDITLYQKLAKKYPEILGIELLPYRKIGVDKYKRLKQAHSFTDSEIPTDQSISRVAAALENSFNRISIGG